MFLGILLRDPKRGFGVEFESLRHREIFEISNNNNNNNNTFIRLVHTRARGQNTIGSYLKQCP